MSTLAAENASITDFADAVGLGQDHAHALGALQQLDDDGSAADLADHVLGLAGPVCERRHRHADAGSRQQLQRAQLVTRAADGDALVQRIDALHFELPQHREPVVRDGGAYTRDDGVEQRQVVPAVAQLGAVRRDVHVDMQRVDHVDLVPGLVRRADDAAVGVEARISGEHDETHVPCPGCRSAEMRRGRPTLGCEPPA